MSAAVAHCGLCNREHDWRLYLCKGTIDTISRVDRQTRRVFEPGTLAEQFREKFQLAPSHYCVPPLTVLEFGEVRMSAKYRAMMYLHCQLWDTEEIVGAYWGDCDAFPSHEKFQEQLRTQAVRRRATTPGVAWGSRSRLSSRSRSPGFDGFDGVDGFSAESAIEGFFNEDLHSAAMRVSELRADAAASEKDALTELGTSFCKSIAQACADARRAAAADPARPMITQWVAGSEFVDDFLRRNQAMARIFIRLFAANRTMKWSPRDAQDHLRRTLFEGLGTLTTALAQEGLKLTGSDVDRISSACSDYLRAVELPDCAEWRPELGGRAHAQRESQRHEEKFELIHIMFDAAMA